MFADSRTGYAECGRRRIVTDHAFTKTLINLYIIMASKLQRKLIRERRIRGLYAHAVWMYYKERELAYREEIKAYYQKLPNISRELAVNLSFCYCFGFAHTLYIAWYGGVGERLLFHYPWRGKVRAKDIIVTTK